MFRGSKLVRHPKGFKAADRKLAAAL
jgi:hypothetical protein